MKQIEQLRTSLLAAREREQLSHETSQLKGDVRAHISALTGKEADEVYYHGLLKGVTVYANRRVELQLNLVPSKWRNVLDSLAEIHRKTSATGCLFVPSVPTSVSNPFSAG